MEEETPTLNLATRWQINYQEDSFHLGQPRLNPGTQHFITLIPNSPYTWWRACFKSSTINKKSATFWTSNTHKHGSRFSFQFFKKINKTMNPAPNNCKFTCTFHCLPNTRTENTYTSWKLFTVKKGYNDNSDRYLQGDSLWLKGRSAFDFSWGKISTLKLQNYTPVPGMLYIGPHLFWWTNDIETGEYSHDKKISLCTPKDRRFLILTWQCQGGNHFYLWTHTENHSSSQKNIHSHLTEGMDHPQNYLSQSANSDIPMLLRVWLLFRMPLQLNVFLILFRKDATIWRPNTWGFGLYFLEYNFIATVTLILPLFLN